MFAWWLSACTYTVFFPPSLWTWDTADSGRDRGDSGVPTTAPTDPIVAVTWGCDTTDTTWTWDVRIDQWTSAGTLDLVRTSDGATEQHELVLVGSDPSGQWDERRAGPLADGQAPGSQSANVDTRFDCAADAATLSFAIRVRGVDGSLLDCVAGGSDPAGAALAVRALDPDLVALGGCHAPPGN